MSSETAVFLFSWCLSDSILDAASGWALHLLCWQKCSSVQYRVGLCVFLNTEWYMFEIVSFTQECTIMLTIAVYIAMFANTNNTLGELWRAIQNSITYTQIDFFLLSVISAMHHYQPGGVLQHWWTCPGLSPYCSVLYCMLCSSALSLYSLVLILFLFFVYANYYSLINKHTAKSLIYYILYILILLLVYYFACFYIMTYHCYSSVSLDHLHNNTTTLSPMLVLSFSIYWCILREGVQWPTHWCNNHQSPNV